MHEISNLIVKQVPCYLFWKDLQGVFLGCNESFAKQCGLNTPSEIVGRTDYDFHWAYTEADFYRKDDQDVVSTGQEKRNFIETQTCKNGDLLYINTSKVPFLNEDGKIIGILGTAYELYKTSALHLSQEPKQFNVFPNSYNKTHKNILLSYFRDMISPLLTNQEIELLSLQLAGLSIEDASHHFDTHKMHLLSLLNNIKHKLNIYHEKHIIDLTKEPKIHNLCLHIARSSLSKSSHFESNLVYKRDNTTPKLSKREKECLHHIIRGKSIKSTANSLNLSNRTVEQYLNRLKSKYGVIYKSQLIEKAIDEGYDTLI